LAFVKRVISVIVPKEQKNVAFVAAAYYPLLPCGLLEVQGSTCVRPIFPSEVVEKIDLKSLILSIYIPCSPPLIYRKNAGKLKSVNT
jgi:hypothetical protein